MYFAFRLSKISPLNCVITHFLIVFMSMQKMSCLIKILTRSGVKTTQVVLRRAEPTVRIFRNSFATRNGNGFRVPKKLFTPGPLMVTDRVKRAMLEDFGPRHVHFEFVTKYIRNALLDIAQVNPNQYTSIPLHGCGMVAIEATIKTLFARDCGTIIVLESGPQGKRIVELCRLAGYSVKGIPADLTKLEQNLVTHKDVVGVIAVHCENASGMVNPIEEFGKVTKRTKDGTIIYMVDAMTTFGAVPINMTNIDALITTSCQSLQGVPGISCVIANKELIERCRRKSQSLVLDLVAQHDALEKKAQFRFTPPTHVMLAFREALQELEEEGGVVKRMKRYKDNSIVLKEKMAEMGFSQYIPNKLNSQGYLVTSFKYPNNSRFVFEDFYYRLSDEGKVICTPTPSHPNCFSIANIGDLQSDDVRQLMNSVKDVCTDMKIKLPLTA